MEPSAALAAVSVTHSPHISAFCLFKYSELASELGPDLASLLHSIAFWGCVCILRVQIVAHPGPVSMRDEYSAGA